MGYTHYWTNSKKKATQKTITEFKLRFNLLLKSPVCPPIDVEWADKNGIGFNGVGDCCETMVVDFTGDGGWNFCKTNKYPYDKLVVACLLLAHDLGIIVSWSSDGNDEDLKEGKEFFNQSIKTVEV
jgi:hypothetical protein